MIIATFATQYRTYVTASVPIVRTNNTNTPHYVVQFETRVPRPVLHFSSEHCKQLKALIFLLHFYENASSTNEKNATFKRPITDALWGGTTLLMEYVGEADTMARHNKSVRF